MSVLEEVPGELVVEGNRLASCNPVIDDDAGDEDGSEDRGYDTDDEGGCKTFHRA